MKTQVKLWSEMAEREIEELFLRNKCVLFKGTPIGNDLMKRYMFSLAKESAAVKPECAMVALTDNKLSVTGQVLEVPYLSKHWKRRIGAIQHIVTDLANDKTTYLAAGALLEELLSRAKEDGFSFLSASLNSANSMVIRAFEEAGFRYAEGIMNIVGPTNLFRNEFAVQGMRIREAILNDMSDIEEAYRSVPFPSRFFSDHEFDNTKALDLYVQRFTEIFERDPKKIFVLELNGKFAGALIALVDEKMFEKIGVKTNVLGMGIIIHPRAARKGVSMALIEHRQNFYKKIGVEYVSFGANNNNFPMIRGLEKLGLKFGSLDLSFHLSLEPGIRDRKS